MNASAFSWESNARSYCRAFPNVFTRGEGWTLYDADGDAFTDFLCGAGTLLLGHNHPAIAGAVRGMDQPAMNHLDMRTGVERDFVETLMPVLPFARKEDIRIHFCGPAGGDAVEASIKLARTVTGRSGVFAFMGSYHGMSQGALAVTSHNRLRRAGLHMKGDVTFLPFPYPYRFPAPWNTQEAADDFVLAQLRMYLEDDHSGTEIPAAIILEPVIGEGGSIPASPRFMRALREICDQYGILMIADEIQSGMGRCGRWFFCEESGVEPDILCVSKGVGGGFPMALLAFPERHNVWKPGDHIGTFRGQAHSLTAGRALIRAIAEENLLANVNDRHRQLMTGLEALAARYPELIGEIRGPGLYIGIEINKTLPSPGDAAKVMQQSLFESRILVETGGRQGAVLRPRPPLNIDEAACARFLGAMDKAANNARMETARKAA